jgi:hypothetical protein
MTSGRLPKLCAARRASPAANEDEHVKTRCSFVPLLVGLLTAAGSAWAENPLPHLQRNGDAVQLIVDGAPYLALGGELHNSSPSSPAYMAPIWDRLAANHVRTVIGAASWELVEPEEGRYDFSAVDDQIKQAHARGIRLVMIWFGAYKNAESRYAPSWVRRDETRFPRAERRGNSPMAAYFTTMLSAFNDRLADADARAFAALMRHIKQADAHKTVIMVQVENEVGLLGDSRDRSPLADAAWRRPVPPELMSYLRDHRAALRPSLLALWGRQGYRQTGSWAEVFGSDVLAEEVFMAWTFGRYVDRVAKAGAAEYPLPLYSNAWLGPQPGSADPGQYPSGGPVARMMDVWKAAAPTLSLLAPDIYVNDFDGTLTDYRRADNPIFIPEAKLDAGNLFVALGQHKAIGFSPFGIEDGAADDELFKAYRALDGMTAIVTRAQAESRIRGFRLAGGAKFEDMLGTYAIKVTGPTGTLGAFGTGTGAAAVKTNGYGLIIQRDEDEYLIVGRGISVGFSAPGAQVEVDSAQEGSFEAGRWLAGRTLNGDERYALFPNDAVRIVRVRLLRRH